MLISELWPPKSHYAILESERGFLLILLSSELEGGADGQEHNSIKMTHGHNMSQKRGTLRGVRAVRWVKRGGRMIDWYNNGGREGAAY